MFVSYFKHLSRSIAYNKTLQVVPHLSLLRNNCKIPGIVCVYPGNLSFCSMEQKSKKLKVDHSKDVPWMELNSDKTKSLVVRTSEIDFQETYSPGVGFKSNFYLCIFLL